MTSSMFCQKIAKAADPKEVYFGALHEIIQDYDRLSASYPTLIAYGGEGEINRLSLEPIFKPFVDRVLVCPQVRYKTPSLQKLLEPLAIPCTDIEMKTFGNMNGAKALNEILAFQKE